MSKRGGHSLHEFIGREAASTGQPRRWCKVCPNEITDRTRSKRCLPCRNPPPAKPNAKVFGPR